MFVPRHQVNDILTIHTMSGPSHGQVLQGKLLYPDFFLKKGTTRDLP
jgi:hypothetical protein